MKDFLIIGNGNATHYKNIFPLMKSGVIKVGYKKFSGMEFYAGDNYDDKKCKTSKIDDKGNVIIAVPMCIWYTTLRKETNKEFTLTKTYNNNDYPKYDYYDAIEVDKCDNIPCDYYGKMGVPTTFFGKWNKEQFELLDCINPTINGKNVYSRLIIKRKI